MVMSSADEQRDTDAEAIAPRVGILVVCAANRARSPLAAQMLEEAAAAAGLDHRFLITSAGLQASEGAELLPAIAKVMCRKGHPLRPHRSRRLTTAEALSSGLIITMTESQRRAVSGLDTSLVSRCFTLQELCRLASAVRLRNPRAPLTSVVHELHELRPLVQSADQAEDIRDPIEGGRRLARSVYREIDAAIRCITPVLFPAHSVGPR